jgi:hypothetical protein
VSIQRWTHAFDSQWRLAAAAAIADAANGKRQDSAVNLSVMVSAGDLRIVWVSA